MAHYAILNNDQTTETLREELSVLWSEMGTLTSVEEPTEEDTAAIEAKQQEIDAKQQEIDNALCVVTGVITGVLETYEKFTGDETIEQEIKDLEESRTGKTIEEVAEIETQIQAKIDELQALEPTEVDNTIYWEGYYGKGGLCKRTSYNTIGGVHKNGGTPFRKNYAGKGYTYDPVRDAFYAPQPYESWTLNEDSCIWECPVEKPEGEHYWKESTQEWITKPEDKYYWHEGEQVWTITNVTDPKPYPSWTIQDIEPEVESQHLKSGWAAPTPKPNDGNSYLWDEETLTWIES